MDRLKTITLAILLSVICFPTWSQEGNTIIERKESIYINVNATSFVTGETLFYKLHSINPLQFTPSTISKIAYVELVGANQKVVFTHKLFLENGTGQGDFFIVPSIATGNYKLLGYTKWTLNNTKSKSFEIDITIINPFQNDSENKINSKNNSVTILKKDTTEAKPLKINLSKNTFLTREKVTAKIQILDPKYKDGNYAISVRKIQDLPTIEKTTIEKFTNLEIPEKLNPNQNDFILPELRGEIVSGKIVSIDQLKPLSSVSIALSIPGKSYTFKLVKTDQNGKFIFNLDKKYYDSNVIIQVVNRNKEDYSIILDQAPALDLSTIKIENNAPLLPNLKTIIEEHAIASQIENTYYLRKSDTLTSNNYPSSFYEPLAKEYILDNYTRFPTIKETTTEVIKEMNFDKNNGKYTLRLKDYDPFTEIEEPPLVLVDGLLIQDIDELFEYRASNIYKICVINSGYNYGNQVFNGLISFITKNQDYETKIKGNYILRTNLALPLLKKKYFSPNYSDISKEARIPDYRYQLLWLPELICSNNDTIITFFTSDKTGTFEIAIEGFSKEGNPISMKEYIKVN